MNLNDVTREVIGSAIEVHSALGPGLLESAYRACMSHELKLRGITHHVEVACPIVYKGLKVEVGYRIDIVVEQRIVVELKAIRKITPVHEQQLLSYLRMSERPIGLLINFHVRHLHHGVKRMVNRYRP